MPHRQTRVPVEMVPADIFFDENDIFWTKIQRPATGINVSCVRGCSPAAHAVVRGITFYRIIIMIVGGILLLKQKF